MIKPQLAEDAILDKVIFPCWVQPKIDGVRALKLGAELTGRSLDAFKGTGITERFSHGMHTGLDGEMTLGSKPNCTERLCSMTTGAMGRFKGVSEMADLHWWVFDYVTDDQVGNMYQARYRALAEHVQGIADPRIHLVPYQVCNDAAELQAAIAAYAADGYEGTIIRNPNAAYKAGRATKKEQELWRVKPWADFEILVTGVTEGSQNQNEAKVNSLGRTERSSAQAGKVANGQVGSIQGTLLADFHDPLTGALLFAKGLAVTAGSGEMTVAEAAHFFLNQSEIVGSIVKVKTMTHGVKDMPRFPTYVSHRLAVDMPTEHQGR